MPSTRDLNKLPGIDNLKRLSRSLAMLDAILEPEWQYRYYSFNAHWSVGEEMASMRNGSGDHYFLLFSAHGAIMKGFDHEARMSPWADGSGQVWPGVLDEVPEVFRGFLTEPAFIVNETTFCLWRRIEDASWRTGRIDYPDGNDPDGSVGLLALPDGDPRRYQSFAEWYYEKMVPLEYVERIYRHEPLTESLLGALNPAITIVDIVEDIGEIGYPT